MIRKETLTLDGVAFCPFMEDMILFGRDRDIVLYDRLLNLDALVIPNVSYTGIWKDIT